MPSRISRKGANLREGEKRIADMTHKSPKNRTKAKAQPRLKGYKKRSKR